MSAAKPTTAFSMFRRSWLTMPRNSSRVASASSDRGAFGDKILVRFFRSATEGDLLRAFLAKGFVGVGALVLTDMIFPNSLALHEASACARLALTPLIGVRARGRQERVRTASRRLMTASAVSSIALSS